MPVAMPPVGERIREARLAGGVSLRGLARAVGVSPSLISQIETGKSRPSVSTLYAITKVLDVSVEELFDPPEPTELPAASPAGPVDGAAAGSVAASVAASVTTEGGTVRQIRAGLVQTVPSARKGPLVRRDERETLELDSGVTWERLGRIPGARVDFLLVTYAPGGSSSSTELLMRHSGVEFGYLLSGELTLTLGFEEYHVRPGDAVSFPSSTPHRYRNDGVEPAVGVWFVHEADEP